MCILLVQDIGLTVSVHNRNPNWCRSSGNKYSDSEVLEYNVHAGVQATLQVSPGVQVTKGSRSRLVTEMKCSL